MRFFMGFAVGASLLTFFYAYDFSWWLVMTISFVVYGITQTIAHSLFDK